MSRHASRRRSLSLSALAAAPVVAAVALLVWRPSGPNPPSPSRRGGPGPPTGEPPLAPDGRPVAGARVVVDWRDDRLGGPARETARTDDRGA